ncbi:hypothetical protein ACRRTK_002784 [Alexandromys fortis]
MTIRALSASTCPHLPRPVAHLLCSKVRAVVRTDSGYPFSAPCPVPGPSGIALKIPSPIFRSIFFTSGFPEVGIHVMSWKSKE